VTKASQVSALALGIFSEKPVNDDAPDFEELKQFLINVSKRLKALEDVVARLVENQRTPPPAVYPPIHKVV